MQLRTDIQVLGALYLIQNLMSKYADEYDKEARSEEAARFFYLRSSITSYIISRDGLGKTFLTVPEELVQNLQDLNNLHDTHFPKNAIEWYRVIELSDESA